MYLNGEVNVMYCRKTIKRNCYYKKQSNESSSIFLIGLDSTNHAAGIYPLRRGRLPA